VKCPNCQFDNRQGVEFCEECGTRIELKCPSCGAELLPGRKFCGLCGQDLGRKGGIERVEPPTGGERKHITALFSDLSGYTAMSERLDPEEVEEIMSRVFGEIAQVITKYGGFIERFLGDAVLAFFGIPRAHEDDPVRAIRAAKEIHYRVEAMSPQLERRVGGPLSMHSGINTGLVVTGQVDLEKGTHGVAGDTINVASRLVHLAGPGEILVGPETYSQAVGHFTFEALQPSKVKGRAGTVRIYRVLSPKEQPDKIHRVLGLRADFVGREVEMAQLGEAIRQLRDGRATICFVCGDAGTGKSRLVEEFKAALDLDEVQWREGHAYAYSQNIPYFPLIDLLNRAFHIEEGDPPEKVRTKIESGLDGLLGEKADVIPYIGSLYALTHPEVEGVSPEFWKLRLRGAIGEILSALAQRGPTVVCLEDLHWADPSSLDLLRFLFLEFRYPTLFLCVYRPPFSLFSSHELSGMGKSCQEIRLQDLSASEAQDMMESLLKSTAIPRELRRFVQEKAEGNPFYLEEVINSLIETETLSRNNGGWLLTRPIVEADIPSTIHGVISGRLDRLEREAKRVLQEASVIGRIFLYDILERITDLKGQVDGCLSSLERVDLIRTLTAQPDLEYIFKHALTQEVVYNGLLKKERQAIHERIGLVMEQVFHNRLPEFYETLAFHFKQGRSLGKAVDYLVKSGEKSWRRYALEESHQYFREAFDLLSHKPEKTKTEEALLIDLLIKWAAVYNHRGDYRGLADLLRAHGDVAESLDDRERLGMFYGWLGFALWTSGEPRDGYGYLRKALELGEEIDNRMVIGYACAWLAWACGDLGLIEDGIQYGKRAQETCRLFDSDQKLFRFSLGGMGLAYYFRGDSKKVAEVGEIILEYGQSKSDVRSTVFGHLFVGMGHFAGGDFPSAIQSLQRAIQASVDPIFSNSARFMLGMSYISNGQVQEAEKTLQEVIWYSEHFGAEFLGTLAQGIMGVVSIARGELGHGVRITEDALRVFRENENKYRYATTEYFLGRVYSQIAQGAGPKRFSTIARNFRFLMRNLPVAGKKAQDHFTKAIAVAREIGAKGVLGQACLDLGVLYQAKGRTEQAEKCVSEALLLFEECEAEAYLKRATEALRSL
jgi:class 3 adenylate cyclase/tetratricopeptide (TPR) repeat protein